MVILDLSVEAASEVERLTKARGLAAGAERFPPDRPLIGIARRSAVRRALGGRVLLLWRLAYEDSSGRLVESALVAMTIELSGARFDVRHASWSYASLLALVHDRCGPWCASVQDAVYRFTATRVARERAVAGAHVASTNTFQAGLFDRRAEHADLIEQAAVNEAAAEAATRLQSCERAAVVVVRPPRPVLVLVP